MMNFEEFKSRIISLEVVYSIRDKVPYEICSVQDKVLTIKRSSTGKEVKIQLDELYKFYTCETEYTIKNAKKYITGYVYSPAVAVIKELVK